MKYYTFYLTTRGLCSELNSLLGFYESIIDTDCQVYINANKSQYFKTVSIYEVFNLPDIFVDTPHPKAERAKPFIQSALRSYKTKLTKHQCNKLFSYTDNFQNKLHESINKLSLPLNYNCFHIRRGDKVNEKPSYTSERKRGESLRFEFSDYMDAINSFLVDVNNLFIMTDDFKCIQEGNYFLLGQKHSCKIFSLTQSNQDGHSTQLDRQNKKNVSEQELVQFFAEIEIAKYSDIYVGTLSSNVYRYIMNTCTTNTKFITLD